MTIKERIIHYIENNRVSTTEAADALGKSGNLPNVLPVNQGEHLAGKVKCIFTANHSNYDVHEQIREIEKNDIVVVFCHNCEGRAIFGDLVSKFILLYKEAKAVVVDGMIRDVGSIRRERFNVWSTGVSPLGCFNKKEDPFPKDLQDDLRKRFDGAVAVCDDGGVVIIENDKITDDMLERLHRIEMQEDIWFFCLDTLKWDTKKIVCDKAYLIETDLLSTIHLEKLAELNKPLDK